MRVSKVACRLNSLRKHHEQRQVEHSRCRQLRGSRPNYLWRIYFRAGWNDRNRSSNPQRVAHLDCPRGLGREIFETSHLPAQPHIVSAAKNRAYLRTVRLLTRRTIRDSQRQSNNRDCFYQASVYTATATGTFEWISSFSSCGKTAIVSFRRKVEKYMTVTYLVFAFVSRVLRGDIPAAGQRDSR